MSDTKPGDLPAFPLCGMVYPGAGGLTKREYFAAAALQGLLAAGNAADYDRPVLAESAVEMADALLAALEGKHE